MEYWSAGKGIKYRSTLQCGWKLNTIHAELKTPDTKSTSCRISFIWKVQKRRTHRDRKWIHGFPGLAGVGGGWGVMTNRYGVSLEGDEIVLEFDSGDGCTILWLY